MSNGDESESTAADSDARRLATRPFGRLGDRIIASDPAFSRLRLAGRAMLTLLASGGLLAAFHFIIHPLPIAAFGIAVVVSFISAIAVRDPTVSGQAVTRLWIGISAMAAIGLATLLSGNQTVADLVFLAVIFAAVYVRKFGVRWFAAGMIAFMAYFMGGYLKPAPGDLGWVVIGVAMALLVSQTVTTLLLSDDRESDFRRALTTIDRRINLILRDLLALPRDGAPDRARWNRLTEHVAQLRDIMLMAEGFLPQGEEGSLAADGAASELALTLFEVQLSVERMIRASHTARPPNGLTQALLSPDRSAVDSWIEASPPGDGDEAAASRLLLRVHKARQRIDAALSANPSPAFAGGEGNARAPQRPPAPERSSRFAIPVAFQAPIQITLACGLALGLGLLLSPVRWYWAVITAFIVFNNTRSRADTAMRAFQRSAGTFGGLIAGTLAAVLLHGQMAVSAVSIIALFFIGLYFVQVSYGIMIFCVTIALALIYGMVGMFSPDLLLIRLEETVVGALAGTASAFLVFPVRTSAGVGKALDAYCAALGKLVAAAREHARGETADASLFALSRAVDRAYADLANTVRPLGGPWNAVTRFGAVRGKLLYLSGGSHWGRTLARGLDEGPTLTAEMRRRIEAIAAEIEDRLGDAKLAGTQVFERKRRARPELVSGQARQPLPVDDKDDPALALEVISALLQRVVE